MPLRVFLYIDGFNLYYGLFRGTPVRCAPSCKWLDPVRLGVAICAQSGINGSIGRVHYCSAPALPGIGDPQQATRQQHFFRALEGLPEVTLTLGQHTENPKYVRHVAPGGRVGTGSPFKAMVREEKGSDVNLASFLVRDAALGEFDLAIVLSNDSDLSNAVRIAVNDFSKPVYVVSPHVNGRPKRGGTIMPPRVTSSLAAVATRASVLDHTLLAQCRLPDPAFDRNGRLVHCPSDWR